MYTVKFPDKCPNRKDRRIIPVRATTVFLPTEECIQAEEPDEEELPCKVVHIGRDGMLGVLLPSPKGIFNTSLIFNISLGNPLCL